jgi:hypothetical protein
MTSRIVHILAVALVVLVTAACGAGAPASSPGSATPTAGGPVLTEADAVARVVAVEPRFSGVTARDPDLIGQGAWYEVTPASGVGAYLVTIRIGWGDCPAGCIDEHRWTYAVTPDGSVTLQSESGSPVPDDAWPSPSRADEPSDTGIRITAVVGPTCPVERFPPDPACAPRPAADATILIAGESDGAQQMVVTDDAGTAVAALAPGNYTVSGEGSAGSMTGPEPQQVIVERGSVTEVTLTYDTGIR